MVQFVSEPNLPFNPDPTATAFQSPYESNFLNPFAHPTGCWSGSTPFVRRPFHHRSSSMNKLKHFVSPLTLTICYLGCTTPGPIPASMPQVVSALTEDPLQNAQSAPMRVPFSSIKLAPGFKFQFPKYPIQARIECIQGDVIIEVWVNEAGIPYKSTSIWGPVELRSCAESVSLEQRFEPYIQDGKAIPVRFRLKYLFRVQSNRTSYQEAPKIIKL